MTLPGEELRQKQPDYALPVLGEDEDDPFDPKVLARDRWADAYSLFQLKHAESWHSKVGWAPTGDLTGEIFLSKLRDKRAKTLVRVGGIPPGWRGGIWTVLSGAKKARLEHPTYYTSLLAQLESHPTRSTRDIEKDVSRTMSGHSFFKEQQGEGQSKLKRGLCAFSFKHPAIGYAQSMSTVLGALLLHYHDEEEAFWVFDCLVSNILPQDYYTPSMIGTKTDCAVLKRLIKKRLPKLSSHLIRKGVDLDMVSVPWFMCLYVHVLPLPTAMRIWDALFYKFESTTQHCEAHKRE